MKHLLLLILFALPFFLSVPAPAEEQAEPTTHASTATLAIKTRTPSGEGIRCDVILEEALHGRNYRRSGTTDGDGVYVFVEIPPGEYLIFVDAFRHGSAQTHATLKAGDFPIVLVTIAAAN